MEEIVTETAMLPETTSPEPEPFDDHQYPKFKRENVRASPSVGPLTLGRHYVPVVKE